MLRRGDLVVLRFCGYAELPELFVQLAHKRLYARLYRPVIVVVELLSLRRFCSEKRSPRENEVLATVKELFVYEEIFLLRADGRHDLFDAVVSEQLHYPHCMTVYELHRTEEGRFLVERLAAV